MKHRLNRTPLAARRPDTVLRTLVLAALGLLASLTLGLSARAGDVTIGVVEKPCADIPLQPTDAHKASADWYGNWMRDWLAADFGQRCRYESENSELGAATQRRVVFFGDSITEGWKGAVPSMFNDDVLDRGIGGQTTEQMLVRFRSDVLALHPAVVHILAGTNDVAGNRGPTSVATIEGNLQSLVELARANGIAVVLGSIPPARRFGWSPVEHAAETIVEINKWLRDYARREHVVYVDYHAALGDGRGAIRPAFSEDGVHPNRAAYEAMRPLALAALRAARAPAARPSVPAKPR